MKIDTCLVVGLGYFFEDVLLSTPNKEINYPSKILKKEVLFAFIVRSQKKPVAKPLESLKANLFYIMVGQYARLVLLITFSYIKCIYIGSSLVSLSNLLSCYLLTFYKVKL